MRHFFVVVCLSVYLNQVRKHCTYFGMAVCYMLHMTDQKVRCFMFEVSVFDDNKNTDLFSLKVTCKYN